MSNLVKTLNLFFYNMMSFSGHPVCHLGLIWCILLGNFLCFQTKCLVWVFKGYLTKFSQCSNAINTKIIQMHLGLRPFTMCMALATAFAHKHQCFQYKLFQCIWVIFDLQMCISNGCGFFASKTSIWYKFAYKIILQDVWANLVFKHASGHRPCPIACSAFKSVPIITNFSIFAIKTL